MQLPRRRPDIFIKIIAELSKGKDGEQVKAIKMDKLIDQCEEKGFLQGSQSQEGHKKLH